MDERTKRHCLALCEAYQQGLRHSVSYRSHTRRCILVFYRWLKTTRIPTLKHLSERHLSSYHAWLCSYRKPRGGGSLSTSTIRERLQALRLWCKRIYREGLVDRDLSLALQMPRAQYTSRVVPTRGQANDFLDHIDTSTKRGLRDRTLFELMYSSGLRSGEVATLRWEDLRYSERTIVVRGKGGKERVVPLSEVALGMLLHYADAYGLDTQHGPLFRGRGREGLSNQAASRLMREQRERQKQTHEAVVPQGMVPHSLRHATATHLLENGAGVRYVQELLGHESLQTTVTYTQHLYESIARVYTMHHPRGRVGEGRFGQCFAQEIQNVFTNASV